MPEKLTDMTPARNTQAKSEMGIVLGCQRLRRATWEDAIGIVRNGAGYVRQGSDLILINSEAFETAVYQ